jgi:hypothetical protein
MSKFVNVSFLQRDLVTSFGKMVNKLAKKQLNQHVVHAVLLYLLLAAVRES